MKKGFTLVELIAVITLLGLLLALVYPKIIDIAEKKQADIDDAKKELIYNAAKDYMNEHLNDYPETVGTQYCISIETLDKENLIPIDISDVYENYNYLRIKIGLNNQNSYTLVNADSEENCMVS
jgi:prepilin-type N-terminal cleavage/methylation domain-containing protein